MCGVGDKGILTMWEYVLSIALLPIISIIWVFYMLCLSIKRVIVLVDEEEDELDDWEGNY